MSFIDKLEKSIIGKIMKIENAKTKEEGKELIKESEVSKHLKALKNFDEVSAEKLQTRYIDVVKSNSEKIN